MDHEKEIQDAAQKAVEAALASRTAVHAARDAAQAIEIARDAQLASAVAEAVKSVFALENSEGQKRFIDVTRVPLICQAILGIDDKLGDIKKNMVTQDQFSPIKSIVYGLVGLVLTGVGAAIVASVLE